MALVWAIVVTLLQVGLSDSSLAALFSTSSAYAMGIVLLFVFDGVFGIVFLFILVKRSGIRDWRRFLRIERIDVKGIWLAFGLGIALQVVNVALLWQILLLPARDFLVSLGPTGGKIGLGTVETVPFLSPSQASFVTAFLLTFWWIEVPEELFFRGYFQNELQRVVGKRLAMFLSALFWDVAHLWSLVNIVERFFYGLVYAFVFKVRQNTTSTMFVHPIGNRSLLLATVIPAIWGVTLGQTNILILGLSIYVGLLLLVISVWKILRLDRDVSETV